MQNSSQTSNPVVILAKQARHHGYRSIFSTGAVLAINPHRGRQIKVSSVQDFNAGQVVVKDCKGKRRPVPLSTIQSIEVEAHVAEKIKPLPKGDSCAA